MRSNLTLETVDGADAEANLASHLADANALGQLAARALDLVGFRTRSAKPPAYLARLADELAVPGELVLDDVEPAGGSLSAQPRGPRGCHRRRRHLP